LHFYTKNGAFAALKADGSITAWGELNKGGAGAPAGSGYIKIYSTKSAFEGVVPLKPPHAVIDPSALRAAKA
jgi:hypothetical protein